MDMHYLDFDFHPQDLEFYQNFCLQTNIQIFVIKFAQDGKKFLWLTQCRRQTSWTGGAQTQRKRALIFADKNWLFMAAKSVQIKSFFLTIAVGVCGGLGAEHHPPITGSWERNSSTWQFFYFQKITHFLEYFDSNIFRIHVLILRQSVLVSPWSLHVSWPSNPLVSPSPLKK